MVTGEVIFANYLASVLRAEQAGAGGEMVRVPAARLMQVARHGVHRPASAGLAGSSIGTPDVVCVELVPPYESYFKTRKLCTTGWGGGARGMSCA